MTEPFRIRIFGYPVPQGRPRAFVPKGWTRPVMHDPKESRAWKEDVKGQILTKLAPDAFPLDGPLSLRLIFVLLKPPSVSKRRVFPVVKPDVDNLAKAVKDAMTGVVYRDDSQIIELFVRKEYGERPGVDIEVRGMEPVQAVTATSAAAQESLL